MPSSAESACFTPAISAAAASSDWAGQSADTAAAQTAGLVAAAAAGVVDDVAVVMTVEVVDVGAAVVGIEGGGRSRECCCSLLIPSS